MAFRRRLGAWMAHERKEVGELSEGVSRPHRGLSAHEKMMIAYCGMGFMALTETAIDAFSSASVYSSDIRRRKFGASIKHRLTLSVCNRFVRFWKQKQPSSSSSSSSSCACTPSFTRRRLCLEAPPRGN